MENRSGHKGGSRPSRGRGASRVRSLVVGILLSAVLPVPSARAASDFLPVADTYVDASSPNGNFGARSYMRADASPVRASYLRFVVAGAGSQTSAVLRIFVETTNGTGLELRPVSDNSWTELGTTSANAPERGSVIGTTGAVASGTWHSFDVSSIVTGDGTYSFALTTPASTAIRVSSREGANPPRLFVPAPPGPSPYHVWRDGSTYHAQSQTTGTLFSGSLKFVVENAVADLEAGGGGELIFLAGQFDLGSTQFEFYDVTDVTFTGQGIGATTVLNDSSAAADTEPFDFVGAFGVTIRDMTVSAGGPPRSTSDALDFDQGNDTVVERVEVVASRGRGIVFDGKNAGWTSQGNTIRDCVIGAITGDGIELLASSNNVIEGCTITGVGGHGIQINKSSLSAAQPNKKSNDNVVTGNTIDQAGQDGINIVSGDRNQLLDNLVTNSADDTANRDGIRITSGDSITCNDNEVDGNTATDNQSVATQRYGLSIASSLCNRTVVGANDFSGNLIAPINDAGTDTQYVGDSVPPTIPTGLIATAVNHARIDLGWSASSDDVGVAGYTIVRDGVAIDTVGGGVTTYQDTGVAASTTYEYRVDAFDAGTNHSALSDPASATTPSTPSAFTLTTVADTYGDSANPSVNFGTRTTLRVDASPTIRTYVRFEVQGLSGPAGGATLRLFANSGSSVGIRVWSVSDNTWGETTMLYPDSPAFGATIGTAGPFASGSWVEVDVSSFITGNGTYSLGVDTTSNTAISFSSREGASDPELVVQT